MIPQLCFDVQLCQTFLDISRHFLVVRPRQGIVCESWSIDEHNPLAVQLKLVGRLDSVDLGTPSAIPDTQTRSTSAVYELQVESLESENRSCRLSSLPWFSQICAILSH